MTALLDITESLCLAVAAGDLGQAQRVAVAASDELGPKRASRVQAALFGFPVSTIAKMVAENYDVTVGHLRGPQKHRRVSRPRAVAMYLARYIIGMSYPQIGRWFGGRHHTTVMSAEREVERVIEEGGAQAEEVLRLRARLRDMANEAA